MRCFYLTFVLFLSLHIAAEAQVLSLGSDSKEVAEGVRVTPSASGLLVFVRDSARRAISGAHFMAVSGRDTIKRVTDERGRVRHEERFLTDSVELIISYLGYKTKRVVVVVPSMVEMELMESSLDLTEIVVVGEALAVVMKGDTVYYNAKAFKTFEGDDMAAIFEKLPGMEVSEGGLTYLGKTVHRLTIDNTRLFGDDVLLAIRNIRVDDVVGVEVYKEADDWDRLNEVENPALLTVANVITKSKPTMIRRFTVNAAVGADLDSDFQNGNETRYIASGKLVSSRVGEIWTASAMTGEGPPTFSYKSKQTVGDLSYTREETDKFHISTKNNIKNTRINCERWESMEYFPTEDWSSRDYYTKNASTNRKTLFSSQNSFRYVFRDKSWIEHGNGFSYTDNVDRFTDMVSATQDGVLTQSRDMTRRDKNKSWSFHGGLHYKKAFESKITLFISASAAIAENNGDDWRIDTLSSSTSQLYLENNSDGWSRKYNAWADLSLPLMSTLSLSISDGISYIDANSKRTSVDILTGIMNVTNSHDYLTHELNNNLSTNITYRDNKMQKGMNEVTANIGWVWKDMQREERFPKEYEFSRTFNHVMIRMSLNYKFSAFNNLRFSYHRQDRMLSLSDLREFLDDSNPAMLRVGNPRLKMPIGNSLSVTGSRVKGASTYELEMSYDACENSIVDKHYYFSEETYLPEYNYTASAGSSLVTKENRVGERAFYIKGKYSARSKILKSTINAELSYSHRRAPAYVNEKPIVYTGNYGVASFSISGNFSSVFSPSLRSRTSYGYRHSNSDNNGTKSLVQILNFDARSRIAKRIDLNWTNAFRWDLCWPEVPDANLFKLTSNLSLGYIFREKKNFTVRVEGYDLFNKSQHIIGGIDDEYISTFYLRLVGRYVMLHAEWKF